MLPAAGKGSLDSASLSLSLLYLLLSPAEDFFSLSPEEKNKLAWQSPESNRGYSAPGREKTSRLDKGDVEALRNKAPDLKETFESEH